MQRLSQFPSKENQKPNLTKLKITDPDRQDLADYSLEYAVKAGDASLVSECIEQGANPDARSYDKPFQHEPMLSIAASKGRMDICRILLKNGANANQQDSNGYTALMAAIINNRYDTSLLLLFHGADASIRETCSYSPNNAWDFANGRGRMRLALVYFESTKELIGKDAIPFGKNFLDCIWGGA
jgi:ankyrin repeat protein